MITVNSNDAPAPIGPYSHAVQTGQILYCSGQTPFDPVTMKIAGNTIEEQTERVIKNIQLVLSAKGLTLSDVIKTTVFLSDMKNFNNMNEVYAKMFNGSKPARSTIEAAALPYNALIEIECIAEVR
jgi:2-iminobutanoate/2-iminopropanoate deaminase